MKSTAGCSAVIGLVPAETEEAQEHTEEAHAQMAHPSGAPTKSNAAQSIPAAHRRNQ